MPKELDRELCCHELGVMHSVKQLHTRIDAHSGRVIVGTMTAVCDVVANSV